MPNFNSVTIMGNLTRDPELRVTPKGTAICQFGLAINRRFKAEDGQQRDETTFVDCEAWSKTAELIAKYLAKGRCALVQGRLKFDQWEDKTTGQKRSKLKVVVESVQFIGGERDTAPAGDAMGGEPGTPPPATKPPVDEDCPF